MRARLAVFPWSLDRSAVADIDVGGHADAVGGPRYNSGSRFVVPRPSVASWAASWLQESSASPEASANAHPWHRIAHRTEATTLVAGRATGV